MSEAHQITFSAVTDAIWLAAIGGAVTIIGGLVTVILAKINRGARVQSVIHDLVNSKMGAVLKVSMLQAKRIAEITKAPGDILVAEEAEKLWYEHQKKQELMDLAKETVESKQ